MKKIKTHTFLGKRYNIVFLPPSKMGDADGKCDHPEKPYKSIKIRTGLSQKEELETIVHELLHAMLWPYDEEIIDKMGKDISGFLWRLGYRKVPEGYQIVKRI